MNRITPVLLVLLSVSHVSAVADDAPIRPYDRQVAEHLAGLNDASSTTRAAAAESLGFLRAYSVEGALIERLDDESTDVRREAAMALAWCGGRGAVGPLLDGLQDDDWIVRQAAHVSLTNLTGMEFPFDTTASQEERTAQARRWSDWWATVPADRPADDVLQLLAGPKATATDGLVTASTTYRGPTGVLLDGQLGPGYWQTKNVPFPQWCSIDLGKPREVSQVIVHQYGAGFVMTEYDVAVSLDNERFEVVKREKARTPVRLVVDFPKRMARYVRITSYGTVNPTYPTTFLEIEVSNFERPKVAKIESVEWRQERGLRALGTLGGQGATEAVLEWLGPTPTTMPAFRPTVRAGIRSLGRLQEEAGLHALIALLDDPFWARVAAEALGDFGDARAVPALIEAYPKYAKTLQGQKPANLPRDDRMGFPDEDRMLETPYWIIYSLGRLPLDNPKDRAALRQIAPLLMANLPGDHDTFMLYEPEVAHHLTRYLMNHVGLRQQACEHAFELLGQPRRVPPLEEPLVWSAFVPYRIASWLPGVCTEREDLPRLLALLEHKDGWVRLNAAKTIAWLGDRGAIEPVARVLAEAKAEADFGYNGTFKNEEYDDPAPRWREGLIRALGLLGADEHTDLLVDILEDERSVLEIRRAAADALADLGNQRALAALGKAAIEHDFHSIRHVARDALRARGIYSRVPETQQAAAGHDDDAEQGRASRPWHPVSFRETKANAGGSLYDAIVFIKGDNSIPNTIGTVEQADRWRQTYVVTDSGPAYRPGRNLYVLRPPTPDGKVTPLTQFEDGYVAEHELSWDGSHVIFSYRGQEDPWWQIYRINVDGSGLTQLTTGPYHHVGPAYLPDGRIVMATSRVGIRDEYHGYPCTALWVMDADGSDLHPIATNIGRDNEPAILHDGRIVFSRLEVFYSRNKTELTLHAAHADGTQDVVLYGPERRPFWRALNHGPRTPADGQEAPLTHRVLRMTQPQPMPDRQNIIVVTQGGLTLIGPRRDTETIISPDNLTRAYTTPFPLPDGTVLCASTLKESDRKKVDLGLYLLNPATQAVELVYNDPTTADFEPRPIMARRVPVVQAHKADRHTYSGQFVCTSVFNTQEKDVPERGRLVRLVEGVPMVARHSTHTNEQPVWKNHGGTFARVLGTAPLAPDGSFNVEVPADRLMHFQVLDSDRRVLGNQLTWIYPRPGEQKSCVGCHEKPGTTTRANNPLATHYPPVKFLPTGDEFTYRAKAWFKGHLPPEIEERTRTVRSVNLLGR
ncbi:MAG: HEAT repeat domain-containing protein [Thermoguttaceae bacterium]